MNDLLANYYTQIMHIILRDGKMVAAAGIRAKTKGDPGDSAVVGIPRIEAGWQTGNAARESMNDTTVQRGWLLLQGFCSAVVMAWRQAGVLILNGRESK